uniref:Uncharacterized protein n=1 Tax=Schistocephalus solidus TaxID=70667 RepID=A0A0X3P001_SCHSO
MSARTTSRDCVEGLVSSRCGFPVDITPVILAGGGDQTERAPCLVDSTVDGTQGSNNFTRLFNRKTRRDRFRCGEVRSQTQFGCLRVYLRHKSSTEQELQSRNIKSTFRQKRMRW